MQILKSPPNAILNHLPFDKAILILMNHLKSKILQPVSKNFSDDLHRRVEQRNRPKIINSLRIIFFGDQGDVGGVDTFNISLVVKELLAEKINILPNNMPSFFEEDSFL
jgi:hypothetical protein